MQKRTCARIRAVFWIIGALAAAVQAFAYRQWLNADTISYLDISDAVSGRDPARLLNTHWSPLYPVLIGIVNAVVHPSAAWEFPTLHLVNWICFLFAFAAFEFLLRSMETTEPGERIPQWALLCVGYSLFLWASLGMITLMKSHPDLLMSGFLYMAAGILIRIRHGGAGWKIYGAFGLVLGFGYLSKSPMFPLAGLMLGSTLFFRGSLNDKLKGITIAALCFTAVSGPWVLFLSRQNHQFTFGESGMWNFENIVDHVDIYYQNQGQTTGQFIHPVAQIVSGDPPALSFNRPVRATNPLWYEPTYWIKGVSPVKNWREQGRILFKNLRIYARLAAALAGLVFAVLLLAYTAGFRLSLRALLTFWPLSVLGIVGLAMYAAILVDERYIGAFIVLIGLGALFGFSFPRPLPLRTLQVFVALVVVNLAINVAMHARRDYRENEFKTRLRDADASIALHKLGIAEGQPVASITPWVASGWARLARVRIIADVRRDRAERFWTATQAHQSDIFNAFSGSGCRAVVASIGGRAVPVGWQRLAGPYIARLLP